jgi:hypothetical protein
MNYDPLFMTALPLVGLLIAALWLAGKAIFWDLPRGIREMIEIRRANSRPYIPLEDLRRRPRA